MTRFLASQLFEVNPTDPAIFVAVALFLLSVTLLACYFPARRVMKLDPMATIRHE
jgi:putative ABC transport system permease protein